MHDVSAAIQARAGLGIRRGPSRHALPARQDPGTILIAEATRSIIVVIEIAPSFLTAYRVVPLLPHLLAPLLTPDLIALALTGGAGINPHAARADVDALRCGGGKWDSGKAGRDQRKGEDVPHGEVLRRFSGNEP
jgi:hypothetical protein